MWATSYSCNAICKYLRPCHTVQFFLQVATQFCFCKLVTNVWRVKTVLVTCDGNVYLPNLRLSGVELRCNLQEKLHGVSGPCVVI